MNINLTWPGGKNKVAVVDEGSLLERLITASIPMPNSCRRGDCQQCGCLVVDGQFLDRRQGKGADHADFHLACQIEPLSDLSVTLFEDPYEPLETPKHIPAKVTGLDRLSANVVGLSLVLPRSQNFTFRPGQYADIKLKSGTVRSYSIAAYDPASRTLTFHIRLIEGGRFSDWLTTASEGELLQIYGPIGRFYIRDNADAGQTIMVATGTGLAPIFCMLAGQTPEQLKRLGSISIVWGNRTTSDNYYDAQVSELARKIGAEYRAVYSADHDAAFKGRVTDWMPSEFAGKQVFAAGHPQMIADLRTLAHQRGLPHSRFHADAFSFASPSTEQILK